jgi:hypothetical protein
MERCIPKLTINALFLVPSSVADGVPFLTVLHPYGQKIAPAVEPSACNYPKEPVNGFEVGVEAAGAGAPVVAAASTGSPRPGALSASMQPKWPIAGIGTPTPPPGSGTGAKSAKIVNRYGPIALLRPTAKTIYSEPPVDSRRTIVLQQCSLTRHAGTYLASEKRPITRRCATERYAGGKIGSLANKTSGQGHGRRRNAITGLLPKVQFLGHSEF